MKARLPRGFVDRAPENLRITQKMMVMIRKVYELYGFEPIETPLIEYTDMLGKFLPDQDRPHEGVFSFQDDDEQWLSLRYDLTAPLARYVAENFENLPKPYRNYRAGWVFRNEKPGPGRLRQFMQCDADIVGTPGVIADAEMAMMMADVLRAVGLKRDDYVIRINNRKILDGILEMIGLGEDEDAIKRLIVLRAIDKLDKFGPEGVRQLLGKGRMDESGDFTKGAGLEEDALAKILDFIEVKTETDTVMIAKLENIAADNEKSMQGVAELAQIQALITDSAYERCIRIDPSVVRGLEYYTGPVYEAELTFGVTNEEGHLVRFGSVAGGGRYDGLISRFRGDSVPATGFSIGVSRLITALKNLGKLEDSDSVGPVVVLVMDKDMESLRRYQKMVSKLRQAGICAEMYLGGSGIKAQMKYADRRGAPCVIIQGPQEREEGTIQIKDLIEGKRLSVEIEDNVTWRTTRPAQLSVKENDLVTEVRKILNAQVQNHTQDMSIAKL